MQTLALDIETVGCDFDSLDSEMQAYLMRHADKAATEDMRLEERQRVRDGLSLWPLTAFIVAVATVNVETAEQHVYCIEEKALLQQFWQDLPSDCRIVTFNGRSFDAPFLMLRSALHRIRPTRDLLTSSHLDLLQKLSFQGATRRFNLDSYCRVFGIDSPKQAGVSGADVGRLYHEGRHSEIAEYCLRDAQATAKLYQRWREYLSFEDTYAVMGGSERDKNL